MRRPLAEEGTEEIWDVVITPDQPWWKLDLREIWHYRDLLILLVKRDITAQYKQTLLGPLWQVVQPLREALGDRRHRQLGIVQQAGIHDFNERGSGRVGGADDAIDFIEMAKSKTNPFFMYIAFNAPHDPRQSPQEFLEKYSTGPLSPFTSKSK